MIRVSKDPSTPTSLITTKAYDGEDVKQQLLQDHHEKCYLCERVRDTDFEIEHYLNEKDYPELIQDWNNLFLSCRYCNGKKLQYFSNALSPLTVNIEEEIEQGIDYINKRAYFTPQKTTSGHTETTELLKRIFNGTKNLRKVYEERFFEYFLSVINRFQDLASKYLINPTSLNEKAVRDELCIDKEFLGFKYWIIKRNDVLASKFNNDIIWNKK